MDKQSVKKESWESLSSHFSNLDISLSQDSCYSSDGTSVTSNVSTAARSSAVPSFISAAASSLPPFLNSIFKKPYEVGGEDSGSESGYGSDSYDYESDISIVDAETLSEDEEDDDLYYIPSWDERSKMVLSHTNADKSTDESFIGFESSVRFDSNVSYIDPPALQEEQEDTAPEMTFHEMMEIARNSGNFRLLKDDPVNASYGTYHGIDSAIVEELEEHTRDIVDLDKRLFIAYMNGMNGILDECRSHLRRRVIDCRRGRLRSPFFDEDSDSATGVYLDQVLRHVIGIFPNLVVKEEFDELVTLREEKLALEHQSDPAPEAIQRCAEALLGKIEHLLSERLAKGNVDIGDDEISFFAGGIAYALENWCLYTHD